MHTVLFTIMPLIWQGTMEEKSDRMFTLYKCIWNRMNNNEINNWIKIDLSLKNPKEQYSI